MHPRLVFSAACPNGHFYCENTGFRGQLIPSSRVLDGVCDCCDGSDESRAKRSKCVNTCDAAGVEWRAAEAERIRVAEAGAKAKLTYIQQANAVLGDVEEKRAVLAELRDEAVAKVQVLQGDLEAAKLQGSAELLQQSSSDAAAVIKALDLSAASVEKLGLLLVQLARSVPEGAQLLEKLAVATAQRRGLPEGDAGHLVWPDAVVKSFDGEQKSDTEKAAEEALEHATSAQSDAQKQLDELSGKQGKDYGPQKAFFPLDGKCINLKQAQYSYDVCPYGNAKQDHTSLGNFAGFDNNYTIMRFTEGQTCWNGPARTLTVTLVCGAEEILSKVDEPSKCEYTAILATPAACDDKFAQPIDTTLEVAAHEEL
jgi:hypothetical protein